MRYLDVTTVEASRCDMTLVYNLYLRQEYQSRCYMTIVDNLCLHQGYRNRYDRALV